MNSELCLPGNQWLKVKENEKSDTYLDLTTELKKLWNIKMTVIPIVIGAFGMISKAW